MPKQLDGVHASDAANALDATDVTGLLLPLVPLALISGVPAAFWAFGFSLK